ncbi:hypothetical protein ANN_21118 [Periplaneta americana]|uniref:Reverse transcriptase domain-containing protein n=1 Tax=Periplaneta americana TaxID=6978 RepID=A0ABQ8SET2_PERAM|nr:hypothetical protein ANN_21118 [Periplaneta americana]
MKCDHLLHQKPRLVKKLEHKMEEHEMEEQLQEEQFGFRKGKSTRDAIGLLRTIGERYLEKNKEYTTVSAIDNVIDDGDYDDDDDDDDSGGDGSSDGDMEDEDDDYLKFGDHTIASIDYGSIQFKYLKGFSILREEIELELGKMKNGKATGVDGIPIELVKYLNEDKKEILSLYNKIYDKAEWPEDFTETVLLSIPKKNNTKKCNEFRTISLISDSAKSLLRILDRRLYSKMEGLLEKEQFDFRKERGTRDATGLLRTVGERYLEKNKEVYVVFVNLEKAFDRVNWNKLMGILKKIGVDLKERRLFSNLYMKHIPSFAHIHISNASSRFSSLRRNVHRVKPSAQCSTLLSGGGYLQQREDIIPTAARISERTAIPHTAPPATSASGSPGFGCTVRITIKPAHTLSGMFLNCQLERDKINIRSQIVEVVVVLVKYKQALGERYKALTCGAAQAGRQGSGNAVHGSKGNTLKQ